MERLWVDLYTWWNLFFISGLWSFAKKSEKKRKSGNMAFKFWKDNKNIILHNDYRRHNHAFELRAYPNNPGQRNVIISQTK
jgi:hypothetical protein